MKYIGIDISKDSFHVAWNDEKVEVFANSKDGITAFENILHQRQYKKQMTQISLESTGIYHLLFCVLLRDHDWQVIVINPYITSKAIASTLRHVKNDKKDALTIRKVGIMGEGYLFTDTEEVLQLKALLREYTTLMKLKTKCKNMIMIQKKYQETTEKHLKSCLPKLLKTLEETLKQTQKRLRSTHTETQKLLQSIPGIGPICSSALVAHIGTQS